MAVWAHGCLADPWRQVGQVCPPLLFCGPQARCPLGLSCERTAKPVSPQGCFPCVCVCVLCAPGLSSELSVDVQVGRGLLRSRVFPGYKDGGKTKHSSCRFRQPWGSRSSHPWCAGREPFAGVGTRRSPPGGLCGQAVSPRSGPLARSCRFNCLLSTLAPGLWSSRHPATPGSPSQGPRVSGENRSQEEQSSEPAQALNIISSSLNSVGTGAKESAGPPSGSQLSRPGAYLDGLLALSGLHLCSCW